MQDAAMVNKPAIAAQTRRVVEPMKVVTRPIAKSA